MTASAAFLHAHAPARPTADAALAPAAEATSLTQLDARSAAEQYQAADAKLTRKLAAITGAASIVILVFFLAMMWALGGYGPAS